MIDLNAILAEVEEKRERSRPTTRVDPVDEVRRLLRVYSGPARNVFRMHVARLLIDPTFIPGKRASGVEKDVRKVGRMLRDHPEAGAKREAIRQLLGSL